MWIATGINRNTKTWHNTQITWQELVERLKTTTRTSETVGQYKNMNKSLQDNIKDVGGFVGGKLKDGSRKAGNVIERQLLTLDADFADIDFCDSIAMFADYSYCIYSTHKHTEEKPRFRLLAPLSRPCSADEYEAVARMIAFDIGIDMFDDTTYQSNRLMYWPSTSIDGKYVFECGEGKPIEVDRILKRYSNWRDVTEWPVSSRTIKSYERVVKKQEDPENKKGIVGAFCRTYDINSAIEEFLSDKYIDCAIDNRYTFTGGSTAAGLVVYENGKFAYSNHATDPASGKLCNAFDLVRIHLFGELDEDVEQGTPIVKYPSYLKMQDLACKDHKVKTQLHKERLESAKEDFNINDESDFEDEENESWAENLEIGRGGKNASTIDNVKLIIKNDKYLKGKIRLNEFTARAVITGAVPWDAREEERNWTDTDDAGLRHYMEKIYGIKGKLKIEDGWALAIKENQFHPVRDYLNSLEWDGIKRVDTLFIDYFGADDSEYVREVTRKTLVGAVARIITPSIKHDTVLVLVGSQGCGKSEIVKRLGKEWSSDSITTMAGKEAYEQLQGFWIIELPELAVMKKAEVETIKRFITKSMDSYRAAYGHHTETHQRQCIFFGTTNEYNFLKDATGERRFLPVDVNPEKATKNVFTDFKGEEIDQVWAEAVSLFKSGEKNYISDLDILEQVKSEQESHSEENPLSGDVRRYLDILLPDEWEKMDLSERRAYISGSDDFTAKYKGVNQRKKICIAEVWCELFWGQKKDITPQKSREIKDIIIKTKQWRAMKSPRNFGNLYGNQRGFERIKDCL